MWDEGPEATVIDDFPNRSKLVIIVITYWKRSQEFDEIESPGKVD